MSIIEASEAIIKISIAFVIVCYVLLLGCRVTAVIFLLTVKLFLEVL